MRYLFFFLIFLSCSKELKYGKDEIILMGQDADGSAKIGAAKEVPTCADYSEGCSQAFIIDVQGVQLIAVEFKHESEAIIAAKKFRGFYARNWFFDDVKKEPRLERFVHSAYKAKEPGKDSVEAH